MTVEEILEHESRSMGRECALLDCVALHREGDAVATVVLYRPAPLTKLLGDDDMLVETRVVAFAGDRQLFSSIVGSEWVSAAEWLKQKT